MSKSPELTAALAKMAESLPNLTLTVVSKPAVARYSSITGERLDTHDEVWLKASADPDARSVALMVQPENQAAQAHRIAACVNACAGVSDPRALPDLCDSFAAETIKSHCPHDAARDRYDLGGVLASAPRVVQEAYAWLHSREYAELVADVDCYGDERFEFVRMVQP